MIKSKLAFISVGLITFFLLFQMGIHTAQQLGGAEGQWAFLKLCLMTLSENSRIPSIIVAVINSFIVLTVGRMLLRVGSQIYLTCKWNRYFQSRIDQETTRELMHRYREWKIPIRVIRDDSWFALAVGLLKPRIIVSSGLLAMLSDGEREAVLLHERHHCMRRDPLKIFIVTLCRDAFWYIPLIRGLVHYYKVMKELLADRFVMKQMRTEYELGAVLLKIAKRPPAPRRMVGVSFADTSINYRIEQIIEPGRPATAPQVRFPAVIISFALLMLSPYVLIGLGGCVY
ncbi:M56 family metallopeptidase [Paenibacillus sp. J2TS4]|uniref:M56 family metallopeptidase n=1 Tax=Paenibacillus sp. J2TS4 TaxID=2807194 RepID=UPI0020BF7776|nr:M56 family metallopeptidase [Paenibacillus sp. J2TS4]